MARSFAAGAAAGSAATLAAASYYAKHEVRPPQIIQGEAEKEDEKPQEMENFLREVRAMRSDYWPHPFLELSGLISTTAMGLRGVLAQAAHRKVKAAPGQRLESLVLKDGGTVLLHWGVPPEPSRDTGAIVMIFPGLNNDSCTPYIQAAMSHLRAFGYHTVALNYRGVGGQDFTAPKVGCMDAWHDLPEIVEHIRKDRPDVVMYSIGYSMGAAIMLRYIGSEGANVPFRAAVSVAGPLDVPATSKELEEGALLSRALNFVMTAGVKFLTFNAVKNSPYKDKISMKDVWLARSLREIDQAVICPLNGYEKAQDYYTHNDPMPYLTNIKIPTLIIHAKDDPIVSSRLHPREVVKSNPWLCLVLLRRGGHIGWTPTSSVDGESWVDRVSGQFFTAHAGGSGSKSSAASGLRSRL
eukprot:TRINITY_DN59197_c0_g1_i1.p1 TRINITY_DN59197_c0_g1~~TRINITY_DN59197_c0_g1_i1.p1  ORF type:complete len:411 (+),score=76.67 TRINITY_DN59197_c0_g1_i1:134-1366(+)